MSSDYIHGYALAEQQRLIDQAEYWQDRLLLRQVNFAQGERLLEMGCGVGAVLGILGQAYPGLNLAGIDIQSTQIDYAHHHLAGLGLTNVDLQVGSAQNLPWSDNSFDHIYAIWFLEHLAHPQAVLQEAYRVLKPSGTIYLNETDYLTLLTWPEHPDYRYLQTALCDLFWHAGGNPYIGRRLGQLLHAAGFSDVKNLTWGFHFFNGSDNDELEQFIQYICSCIEPSLPQMITKLGKNPDRLQAGLNFLRHLPQQSECAISVTIYRAVGIKR